MSQNKTWYLFEIEQKSYGIVCTKDFPISFGIFSPSNCTMRTFLLTTLILQMKKPKHREVKELVRVTQLKKSEI